MNDDNPHDPLRSLLKEWRINASLPPRFEDGVWQRIAREESASKRRPWIFLASWLESAFLSRTATASYLAVLLLLGLTAGHWQGRQRAAESGDSLEARYVQSVDPYQMPRTDK